MMGSEITRLDWGAPTAGYGGRETKGNAPVPAAEHGPLPPLRGSTRKSGRSVEASEETLAPILRELPSMLVAEWRDDPAGVPYRLMQTMQALAPLDQLDYRVQRSLLADWAWQNQGVRTGILLELSLGVPGSVRSVDAGTLKAFESTIEGAILLRHWGRGTSADRKVAVLLTRLGRIREMLLDRESDDLDRWIEAMTVPELLAVCCILTG
jgi:hypothetical protein